LQALKARADQAGQAPRSRRRTRHPLPIEARLRTAILIDPATLPTTEVAFGLVVTVLDDDGAELRFQITGRG
jgi:transcription elongation factor GreB